jgi:hypothetical protein
MNEDKEKIENLTQNNLEQNNFQTRREEIINTTENSILKYLMLFTEQILNNPPHDKEHAALLGNCIGGISKIGEKSNVVSAGEILDGEITTDFTKLNV